MLQAPDFYILILKMILLMCVIRKIYVCVFMCVNLLVIYKLCKI